jgi:CHAT domain-containing protein
LEQGLRVGAQLALAAESILRDREGRAANLVVMLIAARAPSAKHIAVTPHPRPLAQELYQILIAPIEQDLRGAQAQTLMWSLDGVLRYLPLAALHDGERYLVERYRQVVFTPASLTRL